VERSLAALARLSHRAPGMSTMYSKARIGKHPIHPMLVAFPVTFYTATLLSFAAYAVSGDLFWWRMGLWSNATGVITAVIAAVPGFIDWARGIPKNTPAKATGRSHMLLNVVALGLFTVNLFVQTGKWVDMAQLARATGQIEAPSAGVALFLSGLGVLSTIVAGALGWKLVQTHHVGVILSDEQRRLEPPFTGTTPPRGEPSHGSTLA
jgi:uncharacterized membrane protein